MSLRFRLPIACAAAALLLLAQAPRTYADERPYGVNEDLANAWTWARDAR